MSLRNAIVRWVSVLSVAMLFADATERYKVVLRLDYGHVRGEEGAGKTPHSPWTPPRGLPAANLTLACTESELPTQDAYCSFSHSDSNLTWVSLTMITKPDMGREVYCYTTFRQEDPLHHDQVQRVTLVHNNTVCFSTEGREFDMVRLRNLDDLLSAGAYRMVPAAEGKRQSLRMRDVRRIKMTGLAPEECLKYFSVHTEEDVDEPRIEGDFIHFPSGYVFGRCSED